MPTIPVPGLRRDARWNTYYEDPDTGCWITPIKPQPNGYVRAMMRGSRVAQSLHRVYYELLVAPIPPGLTIDHLCKNPRCVNPGHLEPVTSRTNTLRSDNPAAQNARKTHCSRRGHPLEGDNLIINKNGARVCRECARESNREFQRRTGKSREWQKANRDRVNAAKRARRARLREGVTAAP